MIGGLGTGKLSQFSGALLREIIHRDVCLDQAGQIVDVPECFRPGGR